MGSPLGQLSALTLGEGGGVIWWRKRISSRLDDGCEVLGGHLVAMPTKQVDTQSLSPVLWSGLETPA